jgi:hypothetical protein
VADLCFNASRFAIFLFAAVADLCFAVEYPGRFSAALNLRLASADEVTKTNKKIEAAANRSAVVIRELGSIISTPAAKHGSRKLLHAYPS